MLPSSYGITKPTSTGVNTVTWLMVKLLLYWFVACVGIFGGAMLYLQEQRRLRKLEEEFHKSQGELEIAIFKACLAENKDKKDE